MIVPLFRLAFHEPADPHRMRHALIALVLLSTVAPAMAQLALPGAVAPTPEGAPGSVETPLAKPTKPKPHRRPVDAAGLPSAPTPAKVVPAASLAGQTLYRGGHGSEITFDLRDKVLVVSHLTLSGQGEDGTDCRVDVADMPLVVSDQGQPDGMARISIPVPACPITFDVLDGAALETGDRVTCAFKVTQCRIDPTGLWGPPPSALTPERDKAIERQRTQAEAAVRASFKRLVSTTRDRPTIMSYAREQAQFSSTREEICRGYAGEVKHGFCSTRLTEARASTLLAKANLGQIEKDKRKKKHPTKRG